MTSKKYTLVMEDIANMLIELQSMPDSLARIEFEMLAYRNYVRICNESGLQRDPHVRYEHCQQYIIELTQWEKHHG